jgi:hypothetical protein
MLMQQHAWCAGKPDACSLPTSCTLCAAIT